MIILFHNNKTVTDIFSKDHNSIPYSKKDFIVLVLFQIAKKYPDEKIVWCHYTIENHLNTDFIENNEAFKNTIFSFNPTSSNYFSNAIGYVESSPFININKTITYPTWQMSSSVGYAHASVFLQIKDSIKFTSNFDYFLNSMTKSYLALGLLCYSEPNLLKKNISFNNFKAPKANQYDLFKFIKQHYRKRWVFLALLYLLVYEKRLHLLPFLFSFGFGKIKPQEYDLTNVTYFNNPGVDVTDTIDVLIPTIGRKQYLYDFLHDLKKQTILPKNVIIVEQNADPNLGSELDFLTKEEWPFIIKHTFTHQLGACNARNIALDQLESKWVFFADDDIRIDPSFLTDCIKNCKNYNKKAITLSCLQKGEEFIKNQPYQWTSFGTCSSFVDVAIIKEIRFDLGFEFGYVDDRDYGMKIRYTGTDVIFFSTPRVFHVKAQMGGLRTKFKFEWASEKIWPKPSPTVMLYKLLYDTEEMINGYKTVLCLKYYTGQPIRNPFSFLKSFNKQWSKSVFWANKLKERM